jgi:hypothetical protein
VIGGEGFGCEREVGGLLTVAVEVATLMTPLLVSISLFTLVLRLCIRNISIEWWRPPGAKRKDKNKTLLLICTCTFEHPFIRSW